MDTCPHRKIQMKPTQSKYKQRWKDKHTELKKKKKKNRDKPKHTIRLRLGFHFNSNSFPSFKREPREFGLEVSHSNLGVTTSIQLIPLWPG